MGNNIEEIIVDITKVRVGVVAHGVNCQGVMGSGVAKAIRDEWPQVYRGFVNTPTGRGMLGKVDYCMIHENLIVANCYTQEYFGRDGRRYASLSAIEHCLVDLLAFCSHYGYVLYMPRIGCGLGGLDWDKEVKPLIESISYSFPNVQIRICSI